MIGYFYSPQWFLAEVPLVQGEPAAVQDRLRRRPGEGRLRLPGLPAAQDRQRRSSRSPDSTGYRLIKNFSWTNKDQNLVAKYITEDGMSPEDAAQKWIDANPDKVNAWLK